ncbi:hypothetical protein ACIGCM_00030 [Pseudomonas sp. NPDC078700]
MPRYLMILLIPVMIYGISHLSHNPSSSKIVKYSVEQTMPLAGIGELFAR